LIGIDTNVLVRYIAQDDAAQARKATTLIERECTEAAPGFVGVVALVELVWVAESCYGATRDDVARMVRQVLGTKQLVVQDAQTVWQALRLFEQGKADFADYLIERSAAAAGCERTATFDRDAAKAGMQLLA
jgi:predicted nucleic-acid-binding protein